MIGQTPDKMAEERGETMPTYVYELPLAPRTPIEHGEVEAESEDDARRQLRVLYATPALPLATRLTDKRLIEQQRVAGLAARQLQVERALVAHREWLDHGDGGERARLTGQDLRGLPLAGAVMRQADLAGASLCEADLRGADLRGANLVGARLQAADLSGADLSGADLSDADLRDTVLTGVRLDGADLWRANLRGCTIAPAALHAALGCKSA